MSDDLDDKLSALRRLGPPPADESARRRAVLAATNAFAAAQAKKTRNTPQGFAAGGRLKSIFNWRTWTMDYRIPLGTAAAALLLFPLGLSLYHSTALTNPFANAPKVLPGEFQPEPEAELPEQTPAVATVDADTQTLPVDEALPPVGGALAPTELPREEAPAVQVATKTVAPRAQDGDAVVADQAEGRTATAAAELAPAPEESFADAAPPVLAEPVQQMAEAPTDMVSDAEGATMAVAPEMMMAPAPMAAGTAAYDAGLVAPQPSGDTFADFEESPVKSVAQEPVSTFSIDVDTASYSYVRRSLEEGWLPEPDAVRIEELINYFSYAYPAALNAEEPFRPTVAVYPTPWNSQTQLLQIGIKGYQPPAGEDRASNLVFLIDTSGSMDEPDKLPLLKRPFALLVDTLSGNDTVSIVAYAGSAGVVLEPTSAADKGKILSALDNLWAGGSTAGAEGIELAYRLAEQSKVEGINRVILATDGDFNVGISDAEALKDYIKTKRDAGVDLSILGFGRGNLDDALMQSLAQNGNGNASYIDSFREAQKVLVAEGGSTLETIARDVKIQIEFNPAFVSEYRLVGYETRALNREDFNNDKVDAGDIGAGHTVTAIYEITPAGTDAELIDPLRYGEAAEAAPAEAAAAEAVPPMMEATTGGSEEIAFLRLRYKLPDETESRLLQVPVTTEATVDDLEAAPNDMRWAAAVAAFGQTLKGSVYGAMPFDEIRELAQGARGEDEDGYRAEFIQMINDAAALSR